METKKHKPIVYRYYDLLKKEYYGKENGIKRKDLAEIMGVDVATQKSILKEINQSPDFDKLISTCGSIYMCKTKEEVDLTLRHTWNTTKTLLDKYMAMSNKAQRNGQAKIALGEYFKQYVTVYEGEKDEKKRNSRKVLEVYG